MTFHLKRIVKENHASPIISCHLQENLLITQSRQQINVYDNNHFSHTDLVSKYISKKEITSITSHLTSLDLIILFTTSDELNVISMAYTKIIKQLNVTLTDLKSIEGICYAVQDGKPVVIDLSNFEIKPTEIQPTKRNFNLDKNLLSCTDSSNTFSIKMSGIESFDVGNVVAIGLNDGRVMVYSLAGDLLQVLDHKRCSKCIRGVAVGNGCVVAVGDDCIVWRWDLIEE
jgi:hypothetical protein